MHTRRYAHVYRLSHNDRFVGGGLAGATAAGHGHFRCWHFDDEDDGRRAMAAFSGKPAVMTDLSIRQ
jgi:hypothetical protein